MICLYCRRKIKVRPVGIHLDACHQIHVKNYRRARRLYGRILRTHYVSDFDVLVDICSAIKVLIDAAHSVPVD